MCVRYRSEVNNSGFACWPLPKKRNGVISLALPLLNARDRQRVLSRVVVEVLLLLLRHVIGLL